MTPLHENARAYAERGLPVFPLAVRDKVPLIAKKDGGNGHFDATTDTRQVDRWWTSTPLANIGFCRSDTLALDVDPRHSGDKTLEELQLRLGPLPATVRCDTGRNDGGFHLYFQVPLGTRIPKSLGPGIDCKGAGNGYTVLPPSIHPDTGQLYRWAPYCDPEEQTFAELPAPWFAEIKELAAGDGEIRPPVDAQRILAGVNEGRRDREIFRYACRLRHLGLSRLEAEILALKAASTCKPPFPANEAIHKVRQAYKYPPRPIAAPIPQPVTTDAAHTLRTISASKILATTYPETRWAVEGLVPEGSSIWAGRPKIGKSWLALNLAVSVSCGADFLGKFPTQRGGVLYAALEDGERRIKKRLGDLGISSAPEDLEFTFSLPRISDGGLEALAVWLDAHKKNTRLAIIDVLSKIRGPRPKNVDAYQHDADQAGLINKVAQECGVPLLLLHHDRKAIAEDWLDAISGTLGVAGGADAVGLLTRDRKASCGRLRLTGRDFEERDLGLDFQGGIWSYLGDGEVSSLSPERRTIISTITEHGAMKPAELATATGLPYDSVRQLVLKMGDHLIKDASGRYDVSSPLPIHFVHSVTPPVNEVNSE